MALLFLPLTLGFTFVPTVSIQHSSSTRSCMNAAPLPTPEESAEALRDYMVKSSEVKLSRFTHLVYFDWKGCGER